MPNRRVLSLWQPWASLCVVADPMRGGDPPKAFETRHWQPRQPLPMRVAVHATQTRNADVTDALTNLDFRGTLQRCGASPDALPFGAIVGVATLTAVYPTQAVAERLSARGRLSDRFELAFGNYAPGRYAWRLTEARQLPEPIPFRGRQEPLYLLADEVQSLVEAQLAPAVAHA